MFLQRAGSKTSYLRCLELERFFPIGHIKLEDIMKRTYLFIATVLLTASAMAQEFRSGIKGGFNYSSLYIDDVEDRRIRPDVHFGFFGQSQLADAVGLQTELLFTTAGIRSTYDFGPFDGTVDFNLSYLQFPVMLNFKIADALSCMVVFMCHTFLEQAAARREILA